MGKLRTLMPIIILTNIAAKSRQGQGQGQDRFLLRRRFVPAPPRPWQHLLQAPCCSCEFPAAVSTWVGLRMDSVHHPVARAGTSAAMALVVASAPVSFLQP